MDTKIQSYEIYTDTGIHVVHAIEKNAVSVILSRLGYKGHELIWEQYTDPYYPDAQNVYTAEKLIEIELDCTGSEIHWEMCVDITSRVANGEITIHKGRAWFFKRLPRVRKRLRRGDFAKARATMAIIKFRQLVELSNELSLKKRGEHHATTI